MTTEEKHGTAIEWTHGQGYKGETWNPITGCSKKSPGCAHCFAEALTARYAGRPGWIEEHRPWTPENAAHNVRLRRDRLEQPLRWRKPRMVFVNSMSDLFHELVPDGFIAEVFAVMAHASQHVFQVLTKRPERMAPLLDSSVFRDKVETHYGNGFWTGLDWPLPNVWTGSSVENRRFVHRADSLRETPAAVRFISAEPLLGPLVHDHHSRNITGEGYSDWREPKLSRAGAPELSLANIDWLIVGGESGPKHRPMRLDWARDLRDAAGENGTAFFMKQLGGARPGDRLEDLPLDLRIREMPNQA